MTGASFLRAAARAIGPTLVFFLVAEALLRAAYFIRNAAVTEIPLPYVVGDDYGPVPPWVDDLRILESDDALIWRTRPGLRRRYIDVFSPAGTDGERTSLLRQFFPALPASLRSNPVWEVALNSEGFRDAEFPAAKPSSAFRIICLGDSWTFGANVPQGQAYPQRLQALLKHDFPQAGFEVLNLGVLGYSSYQGLELLRRRGLALNPDLVVIAFAMNDAKVAGYRDKDIPGQNQSPTLAARIGHVVDVIETYKLLRYLALAARDKPRSPGGHLRAMAESAGTPGEAGAGAEGHEAAEYGKLEPWTRVSPRDFEENIREMNGLARGWNAGVVLLRNELWDTPYGGVLEGLAREQGVPLVDSKALIAEARRRMEEDLEGKLGLSPLRARPNASHGEVEVIFRLYAENRPVPKAISVVGAHPKLGALVPNKIAMYDDGTHGDQRAGDRVWSYAATFPLGTRLFYVYTNSGRQGKWEGLDVPEVRRFTVQPKNNEGTIYRPIETFGKMYMQADGWHPDALGYELIAGSLLEALKKDARVKRYVRRLGRRGF